MLRKIDKFFKSKVGDHSTPYRQEDWKAFESLLNKDKTTGYSNRLLWLVSLFILFSFILFIPGANPFTTAQSGEESRIDSVEKTSALSSSIQVVMNRPSKGSKVWTSRKSGLASQFLPAYSQASEFAANSYVSNSERSLGFSSKSTLNQANSTSPYNKEMGSFRERRSNEFSNGYGSIFLGSTPFLSNLSTSELSIDPSEHMPKEFNEITYEPPSRIGFGLGMLLADENLRDFGFFVEAVYPLNSLFDISVRPGILLSGQGNTALYNQEQYDFGRSEMEIELKTTHRLQVDVPMFISMNINRHRLGIGGGVRLNMAERFEEKQTRISDKDRVGGRSIEEVVVDRSAWQNSSADVRPFMEGFYQYQLHPNWFLGFRSRLTFDSSKSEETEPGNRVQYGVILTYALN